MMLPRLIATDLDGTLLRADGTVSQRTLDALRTAIRAGVEIVVVTARGSRPRPATGCSSNRATGRG
ncbi:HAD family hydrolase [Nocardia salmonicida]|uniref:HAD family hydrolase n=1 Tax=Nocardia salmonicida TaxID=53431 RepID=UPI001471675F|nr:HAD hydrolase family protein [Nocardia salmonicida]